MGLLARQCGLSREHEPLFQGWLPHKARVWSLPPQDRQKQQVLFLVHFTAVASVLSLTNGNLLVAHIRNLHRLGPLFQDAEARESC